MTPIRIAIAEDNTFALKAIVEKLQNPEFIIKYKALDGKELLQALQLDAVVDLVLMDIQMPELNGIETTRQLTQKYPHIKVIMLTTFDDDEKILEAIMAGASGYLLKEESAEMLARSIKETYLGGASMSAVIAYKTLKLLRNPLAHTIQNQDFGLTPREIELLEQLKSGLTYDQVATNLFISTGTVRKHIQNIYGKLQVTNKTEAVQKAIQNRLV
ncbi:MAG: response regulator transcription factor [Cyclobacteriaceae bacterium]|nr:MAG: response regulator transcription factor [Cyclobacteriaceae bacterium]